MNLEGKTVKILEKKAENQIQYWALLGPMVILLSTTILLFKMSDHWYLPVSLLIGIPLCVKWNMKGLVASLVILFSLFIFSYQGLELEDRYWHLGMGMSMALSFVILTLSMEELQTLFGKFKAESQSRLENFLRLDENVKIQEKNWSVEKEALSSNVLIMFKELEKVQTEKQTFEKLVYLAKDELIALRAQHEQLLQDLFYKKQQISQLHERLDENESTIQGFVNSDWEKDIQKLTNQVLDFEHIVEDLKRQIDLQKNQIQLSNENEMALQKALQQSLKRESTIQVAIQQHEKDAVLYLNQIQEKESSLEELTKEKDALAYSLELLKKKTEDEALIIQEQIFEWKRTIEQQNERINLLEEKCTEQEQDLVNSQELQNELQHLQQATQYKNELLDNTKTLLEKSNEEMASLAHKYESAQTTIETLKHSLDRFQAEVKIKADHAHDLSQKCTDFEQQIKDLQKGLEEREKQQLNVQLPEVKPPAVPINSRPIESMYLQLKQQFQERSDVLHATRRELFEVQEQLLAMQKEFEEKEQYQIPEREYLLQAQLLQMQQEMEEEQQNSQQEIDALHTIIKTLNAKL